MQSSLSASRGTCALCGLALGLRTRPRSLASSWRRRRSSDASTQPANHAVASTSSRASRSIVTAAADDDVRSPSENDDDLGTKTGDLFLTARRPSKTILGRRLRAEPLDHSELDPLQAIFNLDTLETPLSKFEGLTEEESRGISLEGFPWTSSPARTGDGGGRRFIDTLSEEMRKQNRAVWQVTTGVHTRDWELAFLQGWQTLAGFGDNRQDRLDMTTIERLVRLTITIPDQDYLRNWPQIRDTLLANLALRQCLNAQPDHVNSAVADWVYFELDKGTSESYDRIFSFWEVLINRIKGLEGSRFRVSRDGTGRLSPLNMPAGLFEAILAAYCTSNRYNFKEFVASFSLDIAVPEKLSPPASLSNIWNSWHEQRRRPRSLGTEGKRIEASQEQSGGEKSASSLRKMKKEAAGRKKDKVVEVLVSQQPKLTHWLRQATLVRVWSRYSEPGIAYSCNKWRIRRNANATLTMWGIITEAVRPPPGLEADAWMVFAGSPEARAIDVTHKEQLLHSGGSRSSVDDSDSSRRASEADLSILETLGYSEGRRGSAKSSFQSVSLSQETAGMKDDAPLASRLPLPPAIFTEEVAAEFARTFSALDMVKEAKAVWVFAKSSGLPSEKTVQSWMPDLLDCAAKKDMPGVEAVLSKMQEAGCRPDAGVWCTVICTYFRAGEILQGLEKMRQFLNDKDILRLYPDGKIPIRYYNVLINTLLYHDNSHGHDTVLDLLEQIQAKGVSPDIYTVNIILRYYSRPRTHNLQGIVDTLQMIPKHSLEPDVVTFTTILDALLRAGRSDAVQRVHQIMSNMGVRPNRVTYGSMIDHLVKSSLRSGSHEGLQAALQLLRIMQKQEVEQQEQQQPERKQAGAAASNSDVRPNEITYTSLVQGFSNFALQYKSVDALNVAEELHREMHVLGMPGNRITYPAVMAANLAHDRVKEAIANFERYRTLKLRTRSLASKKASNAAEGGGTSKRLGEAEEEAALAAKVVPLNIWKALLAGLLSQRNNYTARQVIQEMKDLGYDFSHGALQRMEERATADVRRA